MAAVKRTEDGSYRLPLLGLTRLAFCRCSFPTTWPSARPVPSPSMSDLSPSPAPTVSAVPNASPNMASNRAIRPLSSFSRTPRWALSGAGGFHNLWLNGDEVSGIRGRGAVE